MDPIEIINQEAEIRNSYLTKPTKEWECLSPAQQFRTLRHRRRLLRPPSALEAVRPLGLCSHQSGSLSGRGALQQLPRSLLARPAAVREVLFPVETTFPLVVTGSESFFVFIWWILLPLAAQTPGFSVSFV